MLRSNIIIRSIIAILLFLIVTFSVTGMTFLILGFYFDSAFIENGLSTIHMEILSLLFGLICGIYSTRWFWVSSGKKGTIGTTYIVATGLIIISIILIIGLFYVFTLTS